MPGLFRKIFFNESEITEKQYQNSRMFFIVEAMCSSPLATLVSGSYLAGLFCYLGASESVSSVIMSVVALAGLVQFVSPLVAERLHRRKLISTAFFSFFKLSLAFIMFTPMLFENKLVALAVAASLYLAGHFANAFVTPMYSVWLVSLLPEQVRGKYFGIKDAFTNISCAVLSYIGGMILDAYTKTGDQRMGFWGVGVLVLVLALINISCFLPVREPIIEEEKKKINLKDIFTKPFKNAQFRPVLVINILYQSALYLSTAFFAIFQVSRMGLSYELIGLTTCVNIGLRTLLSPVWGNIASKYSWFRSTRYSFLAWALSMFVYVFMTKENVLWMIWVATVISAVAWAGIGLSLFGLQFDLAPKQNTSIYISCNSAMAGVVGFLSSLAGAAFIGFTNGYSFHIGSLEICDMQLLFIASTLISMLCIWYIRRLEKRMKRKKAEERKVEEERVLV